MSHLLYGAHVHANGIRQHYLRFGGTAGARAARDPVILIPGITSPAITWGFVGEAIGAQLDCYVIDVRGRGLSEAGPSIDYTLDAQAADVVALAKALGLARYSVLGHSMGARIAIRAARLQPPGLARVVLAEPPMSGPGRRPYPAQLPWYLEAIALARKGCTAEDMRPFCPTWTDEQLRLRAEWLHTCEPAAVEASFRGFHEDDVHSDLPHIQLPMLLLAAERADVIRSEDIEECRRLAPHLQVAKVPEAGHMLPWDNAAGFYRALGDFLGCPVVATP
ncbi:MAG: alpha/beta hydrolase [Alphaproteobacteria bacterium]|nr:MAG: alpha/beta hydrolase [Alphaproteobacteria bacterium]